MASKNVKTFRDEIAEQFLEGLEENPKEWHRGWATSNSTGRAYNVATGEDYNGINSFALKMKEMLNEYKDPRWATFKQIEAKGWRVAKGAKGEKVEYWMPIDIERNKAIGWKEYNSLSDAEKEGFFIDKDGKKKEKYAIRPKYYTVFNGKFIEGIPEFEIESVCNSITPSKVIDMIATGIDINIYEDGGDRAYYSKYDDAIHLPEKERVYSDLNYNATVLHELAHATGSEGRLNRHPSGFFDNENYAHEELVAEITSTFMGEYIETPTTDEKMDDHIAYVQNWANEIKADKNYLFTAITEAEKAADYMIEKGDLKELKDIALKPYLEDWIAQLPESGQIWASKLPENAATYINENFQDRNLSKRVRLLIENNEELKPLISGEQRIDIAALKKDLPKMLIKNHETDMSMAISNTRNRYRGMEL